MFFIGVESSKYVNVTYGELRFLYQQSACGQECGATYNRCCTLDIHGFEYAAGYLQDQVTEHCCGEDDDCLVPLTICNLCADPRLRRGAENCSAISSR